jgi:predicted XRE-type DNA-binding protein
MERKVRREITRGTAYEALGYSREEATVRAMRVLIAEEISGYVKRKRMTQTVAALFFGVSQPRISNVLNGKLRGFTIDLLVKMASKTDRVPSLSFRRARGDKVSAAERRAA